MGVARELGGGVKWVLWAWGCETRELGNQSECLEYRIKPLSYPNSHDLKAESKWGIAGARRDWAGIPMLSAHQPLARQNSGTKQIQTK